MSAPRRLHPGWSPTLAAYYCPCGLVFRAAPGDVCWHCQRPAPTRAQAPTAGYHHPRERTA